MTAAGAPLPPSQVRSAALFATFGGYEESSDVTRILHERIVEVSREPSRETVILIAAVAALVTTTVWIPDALQVWRADYATVTGEQRQGRAGRRLEGLLEHRQRIVRGAMGEVSSDLRGFQQRPRRYFFSGSQASGM